MGDRSAPAPPTGGAYLRVIAFAAAIGIPAALIAALFLALIHVLQQWLWEDLPDALGTSSPPWYLVIGLPVVGAGIVLAARTLLPGDGGHPPLVGLTSEPTPVAFGPGIALAGTGTLAFGAVLGPEMTVIALGSLVGVAVTHVVRVDQVERAMLSSAGSFSAISALFGGPLVAAMLLVEGSVGMGAALIPALLPGLVAAAVGYIVFVGFGSWGGLNAPGLAVPGLPPYQGTRLLDLLVGVVVGVAAALLIPAIRRLAIRVDRLHARRVGTAALLLSGGLAVGVLAQAADLLGSDSQDVLFSGQSSVPSVVAETSTSVLVVLLVAKALAYAVSMGCGFRGGPIFPAVFLGVALASLTVVWFDVSPTLAIAVGAGAGMAAQTGLLFSPILFASLLVGKTGADAIPATVLATVAAWLTKAALDRRSTAARLQSTGS
jgi:H+/Cl- antiporter ClcA